MLPVLLFFLACSEKEEVKIDGHFLTGSNSKSWIMVKIWRDNQEGSPIDCQVDDVETFFVNGTYKYGHGAVSCDKQYNFDGQWTLNEDETVLVISFDNENYMSKTLTVEQLSEEVMVLQEKSFGSDYKYEYHSK